MGDNHPDIRPNGLNQKDLVDALYMVASSLKGIFQKIQDDGINSFSVQFINNLRMHRVVVEDSKGNRTGGNLAYYDALAMTTTMISPTGISDGAILELLYAIFYDLDAATDILDTHGASNSGTTTYNDDVYVAICTWLIERHNGDVIGNGTTRRLRVATGISQADKVDILYALFDAVETLTEMLDADANTDIDDTNYEALWYTATLTKKIENSQGNVIGN